ncbi:peptidoglycan-binding protein [Streptomyces sp. H39-S7]|uniref:peptidoglycan-binding protein n=1 Tax=Streptomyces sp. H39-S7 TaxID=3004357 RepID=UPI0022AF3A2D|nr:peptidoglycan-binding protein [Streptomyces sp. H39-S7]MCZ4121802.1 peptidoglycan-binding protein [Streptomyces sp. H39-S7]
MSIPLFDDVEPLSGCICEECARRRLADSVARDAGSGGSATAATRALVVAAAAGTAVGCAAGTVAAATAPSAATHSALGHARLAPATAPLRLTRDQILDRAQLWADAQVPYSMSALWPDGYRQDCSGFISMAWGLGTNAWTGSLPEYATRIERDALLPGDILLFHNQANPEKGSHAVIFGGWADSGRTLYTAMEQTQPHTRVQTTPMAYWTNSDKYVAYRYKYLVSGTGGSGSGSPGTPDGTGTPGSDAYPGARAFGPGANNAAVTRLGTLLITRGARPYYIVGAGPLWGEADRKATSAFQRAQGWSGGDADGLPGPTTWEYLVDGTGRNIPAGAPAPRPDTGSTAPGYPGAASFRPGKSNNHVLTLGRRLVAKGFGKSYRVGPGRTWGEADRRAVEAFQRAQGWSGRDADGYPGPETWRRLFL